LDNGSRRYTMRFDPVQYEQIEEIAAKLSIAPVDVVRRAIGNYLAGQKLLTDSELRHLRVAEYTQVALDAIIREEHPELRDTLVLETNRRMEKYHGA
jgi:hypothetical protein